MWKNVKKEQRRKNYRRLKNELKTATDKAKGKYLDSIRAKITEFQRRQHYDLKYIKAMELGWKVKTLESKTLNGI
jgi:hypothetical protein